MKPIIFDFLTDSEVEKELAKVQQAIKGIGDQSYISFKRLLNNSNEAFSSLSNSTRNQAKILNSLIQCIRQNEIAQKSLFSQWEKGCISCDEYVDKQTKLSQQLMELKSDTSALTRSIEKEIQSNKDATNLLEQKIILVTKLKEKYANLSSEEYLNEQDHNILLKRILELDNQIKSISNTPKETNYNFTETSNFITKGISKLQEFITIGKNLSSLGLDKFTIGLTSSFALLKIALEGSSQGAERLNSKIEYFKSIWNTSRQILTEGTAALYNTVTGDSDSARKNLTTITKLYSLKTLDAKLSEQAYLNQCNINKKEKENYEQIKLNKSEISTYNNILLNGNKSLDERKIIAEKIIKLEKKNTDLELNTINDNFANFLISNRQVLDPIKELFPEQIKLAEEYFAIMSEGGELTSDQQRTLMKAITDITNNLDRPWNDSQREQFHSFFDDAIKITTEYHDKCRKINEQLNSSQRTEAIITTNQNKKTSLESLQEEVRQRKEQYAALGEYERNLGKEQAEQDFQGLKSQGEDFIAYLNGKING
ncbi:hypothetical protein, partial [Parabacteroides distasonis]